MDISPYLNLMVEKGASDLFFTAQSPVKVKLQGKAVSVGKTELTPELTEAAAFGIMNDYQRNIFEETMECDFAIALPDFATAKSGSALSPPPNDFVTLVQQSAIK